MIEIHDIIDLQTNTSTEQLSLETRYLVQYNYTFDLKVKSNGFYGKSHFCVRIGQLKKLCDDLTEMRQSLTGTTKLEDNDSDSMIEFTMKKDGHIEITGQVGGSDEDHFMNFNFRTDQTCIPQFVEDIEQLLNTNNAK